jgi:hypothetical protein
LRLLFIYCQNEQDKARNNLDGHTKPPTKSTSPLCKIQRKQIVLDLLVIINMENICAVLLKSIHEYRNYAPYTGLALIPNVTLFFERNTTPSW